MSKQEEKSQFIESWNKELSNRHKSSRNYRAHIKRRYGGFRNSRTSYIFEKR